VDQPRRVGAGAANGQKGAHVFGFEPFFIQNRTGQAVGFGQRFGFEGQFGGGHVVGRGVDEAAGIVDRFGNGHGVAHIGFGFGAIDRFVGMAFTAKGENLYRMFGLFTFIRVVHIITQYDPFGCGFDVLGRTLTRVEPGFDMLNAGLAQSPNRRGVSASDIVVRQAFDPYIEPARFGQEKGLVLLPFESRFFKQRPVADFGVIERFVDHADDFDVGFDTLTWLLDRFDLHRGGSSVFGFRVLL
jgi:hypothetical protein